MKSEDPLTTTAAATTAATLAHLLRRCHLVKRIGCPDATISEILEVGPRFLLHLWSAICDAHREWTRSEERSPTAETWRTGTERGETGWRGETTEIVGMGAAVGGRGLGAGRKGVMTTRGYGDLAEPGVLEWGLEAFAWKKEAFEWCRGCIAYG